MERDTNGKNKTNTKVHTECKNKNKKEKNHEDEVWIEISLEDTPFEEVQKFAIEMFSAYLNVRRGFWDKNSTRDRKNSLARKAIEMIKSCRSLPDLKNTLEACHQTHRAIDRKSGSTMNNECFLKIRKYMLDCNFDDVQASAPKYSRKVCSKHNSTKSAGSPGLNYRSSF